MVSWCYTFKLLNKIFCCQCPLIKYLTMPGLVSDDGSISSSYRPVHLARIFPDLLCQEHLELYSSPANSTEAYRSNKIRTSPSEISGTNTWYAFVK